MAAVRLSRLQTRILRWLAADEQRQVRIRGAGRSTHKTAADLAQEAAGGDPQRALDLLNPFSVGAMEREDARRKAAESHPESDQGGSQTPPLVDPDAEDVKGQYEHELGGHPTRAHSAQRKAAVIRSARGIELTK